MMRDELDQLLCQRYPALFAERTLPATDSAMGRGFECGDGWFPIIDQLCSLIDWNVAHGEMPTVSVVQVKEKFGSLRFRYRGGNSKTEGMRQMAEALSVHIDEATGHWCFEKRIGNERPD